MHVTFIKTVQIQQNVKEGGIIDLKGKLEG